MEKPKDECNRMLGAEHTCVVAHWSTRGDQDQMTPNTVARYKRVFASFIRYVEASDHTTMTSVDTKLCLGFVGAPLRAATPPAPSTSRFRLTVIRDAYAALALSAGVHIDPTTGLRVDQPAA